MRFLAFLVLATFTIASPATAAESGTEALAMVKRDQTAAEFGTKNEAVAMVKRVQAEFKKAGPDATSKRFPTRRLRLSTTAIFIPSSTTCPANASRTARARR